MDTVHGNEKYQKGVSIRRKRNQTERQKQPKGIHQLHKHVFFFFFATVPIYCIHRGSYSRRMIVIRKDT